MFGLSLLRNPLPSDRPLVPRFLVNRSLPATCSPTCPRTHPFGVRGTDLRPTSPGDLGPPAIAVPVALSLGESLTKGFPRSDRPPRWGLVLVPSPNRTPFSAPALIRSSLTSRLTLTCSAASLSLHLPSPPSITERPRTACSLLSSHPYTHLLPLWTSPRNPCNHLSETTRIPPHAPTCLSVHVPGRPHPHSLAYGFIFVRA